MSAIGGHPVFDASFFEMLAWFAGIGLLTGCIDPRSPWINWIMVYCGTYLFNLPFFQSDPLLLVGLVIDIIYSGIGVLTGALIPFVVAYFFPLRSLTFRQWAGYNAKKISRD